MIALQHNETGELHIVHSIAGYPDDWTVIADPVPEDYSPERYQPLNGALVPALTEARLRQRAIINAARDAAQDGGAETPAGRFDSASRSREFLNGAITNAMIAQSTGAAFSIDWTLADNTVANLTAPQIITAGIAVAQHVEAMHQRARVLKARIDAATTLAEITAVTWTLVD